MRTFFRWLAGLIGIAALAKLLSRHKRAAPPETVSASPEPDPAAELRRKLDEVRTQPAPPTETVELGAPGGDTADSAAPSLDERRAAIHARAQEAIDAMREVEE